MLHSLPIYLILFLLESSLYIRGVHSSNVFSRAIQRTHRIATRHTKGIARDLRLAFGAVLVSEPAQHTLTNERTVYCSVSGSGLGSSSSSGTSNSSSGGSAGTGTSTTAVAAASPTASAVSTPWKLVEAHVSFGKLFLDARPDCLLSRMDPISSKAGPFGTQLILQTVRHIFHCYRILPNRFT